MDDADLSRSIDSQNMLAHLQGLPDQLEQAYQLGLQLPIPFSHAIQAVILAGMGGSAIGGDLLAAYAHAISKVPLIVYRNYELPAWANGSHVLVITSSHSGNTEEALSVQKTALEQNCSTLSISTGGELMRFSRQNHLPHWQFEHHGQPRSAVGYSFGLLAAVLVRLGLMPDIQADLVKTTQFMNELQEDLQPHLPVTKNRARRDAGQLIGRWLVVVGADHLAPVAVRWKTQVNELAKTWAQAEFLPEADHNSLAGLVYPEELLVRTTAIFLTAPGLHPRNQRCMDLTRQVFLQQGVGTDRVIAPGRTRLEQMWSALQYGDYLAYYLALAYGIDPTPVEFLDEFKLALRNS